MAFEWRDQQDGMYGRLSAGIAVSESILSAPEFVNMPTMNVGQTTRYVPIVVYTPQDAEIMWAYEHASGTPDMKVARGKQGTDAQQWLEQTDWLCGTTDWDLLPSMVRGDLAGIEPYRGMRVYLSDERVVVARAGSKWMPEAGTTHYAQAGPGTDNATDNSTLPVPTGAIIETRQGTRNGITNAAGEFTVTYPSFQTATIACVVSNATVLGAVGVLTVVRRRPNGCVYRLLNPVNKAPIPGTITACDFIAQGY